jgi:transcriptional regulator with XRE-family HTH domain
MSFWERIEERRRGLQLSRAEMARRAGISESTVSKALKFGRKPSGAVRRQVEMVLAAEQQLQSDMVREAGAREAAE